MSPKASLLDSLEITVGGGGRKMPVEGVFNFIFAVNFSI